MNPLNRITFVLRGGNNRCEITLGKDNYLYRWWGGFNDTIVLPEGVAQRDVALAQSGNDLIVGLLNEDDTEVKTNIVVENHFLVYNGAANNAIEQIEFFDGTVSDLVVRGAGDLVPRNPLNSVIFVGSGRNDRYHVTEGRNDIRVHQDGTLVLPRMTKLSDVFFDRAQKFFNFHDGKSSFSEAYNVSVGGSSKIDSIQFFNGSPLQIKTISSTSGMVFGDGEYGVNILQNFQRNFRASYNPSKLVPITHINEYDRADVVIFPDGFFPDNTLIEKIDRHLVFSITGPYGDVDRVVTVNNFFSANGEYRVEHVQFFGSTSRGSLTQMWSDLQSISEKASSRSHYRILSQVSQKNATGYQGAEVFYDFLAQSNNYLDVGVGHDIIVERGGTDTLHYMNMPVWRVRSTLDQTVIC